MLSVPGAKPYAADGKLIPIAVTGSTRAQQLPNTPTFTEAGYRDIGLESIGWHGLLFAGTDAKRDYTEILPRSQCGIAYAGNQPAYDRIMASP
ncbi:hypothetical protein ACTMU2_18400 [Cupriavidus basilensis]